MSCSVCTAPSYGKEGRVPNPKALHVGQAFPQATPQNFFPLPRKEERQLPGAGETQDRVTARLLQHVQGPAAPAAALSSACSTG